jgi:hypothetical protein
MRFAAGITVILVLSLGVACDDTIFGSGAVVEYPPGWTGVVALFDDRCESCHSSGDDPDVPDLMEIIPKDLEEGTGLYVVPNEPEASYLWELLKGTDPDYFMPLGMPDPLPPESIQHVEQWILDGAVIPTEGGE